MSSVQRMIGIVGFVFVLGLGIGEASADCPTFPTGFTCKCSGDETKWVCATWGQQADPILNTDFSVSYLAGVPSISLQTADLGWELYSEVISSGAPADIGSLTLSDSGGDDYKVTIANGAGAGAANVGTIDLDDAGFTGFSSIEGGHITGTLTGALTVVQDSGGGGGELTLDIDESVSGPMTIPVLKELIVGADVTADITVTDKVEGGASGLKVGGSVESTVTIRIEDIASGVLIFDEDSSGDEFAGDLLLINGIGSGSTVTFNGPITLGASIDLNGADVDGTLECLDSNAGAIVNGGVVTHSVVLASGSSNSFSGTAQFSSLSSGGIRTTSFADIDGSLTITAGLNVFSLIQSSGDLTSNGKIDVGGTVAAGSSVHVLGDVTGGQIKLSELRGGVLRVTGSVIAPQSLLTVGRWAAAVV